MVIIRMMHESLAVIQVEPSIYSLPKNHENEPMKMSNHA